MRRIIINENDITSNVEVLSSYDVAYVPGFCATPGKAEVFYKKPTLFTNKYTFLQSMGTTVPVFAKAQAYPVATEKVEGFGEDAIPKVGEVAENMFEAGDADTGYRIALYLLSLGIPVYYDVMNNALADDEHDETVRGITVENMYKGLKERFSIGADTSFDTPGDYAIKFITTGGYPSFEYGTLTTKQVGGSPVKVVAMSLMTSLLSVAASRGDSIALIDHTNNPYRKLAETNTTSVISHMRNDCSNMDNMQFGAMFTPWYSCSHDYIVNGSKSNFLPGSIGYLSSLAVQIRDYNPWLAVSGVTRGRVPNLVDLHTGSEQLTNNIADSFQMIPSETVNNDIAISINPITYIRNVGYCIWGNRTLRINSSGTVASSFLNIRSAVSDIKKIIYENSQNTLFEQNTDVTWLNFKNGVTPLLDRMVSNYILTDYSIERYVNDPETGDPVPAYKVLGVVRVQPINSIEVIDLTVQIENSNISSMEF